MMMHRLFLLGCVVVVSVLLFLFADFVGARATNHELLIVSKQHQASRTGVDSNGDVNVTVAEYSLVIEFPATGERDLIDTNKISWVTVDPGKVYRFYCRYGRWSGMRYSCYYGEHRHG